jgi:hypothetical protein
MCSLFSSAPVRALTGLALSIMLCATTPHAARAAEDSDAPQAVEAVSADGDTFLIDADPVFLSEAFQQVKPSPNPEAKPGENFVLGKLSNAPQSRCPRRL